MTYNFDPDRWYEMELRVLKKQLMDGELTDQSYEKAVEDLEQRYNEMVDRLDGTYQIDAN
jgi:hypothetical protein